MARRSHHNQEELAELIIKTARLIADTEGVNALSAREIARRIGYSPGTLYNFYKNLDEILLYVQADLLSELDTELARATKSATGSNRERLHALTSAYSEFAHTHAGAWRLLSEHVQSSDEALPDWYVLRQEQALQHFTNAITPYFSSDGDAGAAQANLSARALWASLFGATSLDAADRLIAQSDEPLNHIVSVMTDLYLDAFEHGASRLRD